MRTITHSMLVVAAGFCLAIGTNRAGAHDPYWGSGLSQTYAVTKIAAKGNVLYAMRRESSGLDTEVVP